MVILMAHNATFGPLTTIGFQSIRRWFRTGSLGIHSYFGQSKSWFLFGFVHISSPLSTRDFSSQLFIWRPRVGVRGSPSRSERRLEVLPQKAPRTSEFENDSNDRSWWTFCVDSNFCVTVEYSQFWTFHRMKPRSSSSLLGTIRQTPLVIRGFPTSVTTINVLIGRDRTACNFPTSIEKFESTQKVWLRSGIWMVLKFRHRRNFLGKLYIQLDRSQ
jgi:hypothetical protein